MPVWMRNNEVMMTKTRQATKRAAGVYNIQGERWFRCIVRKDGRNWVATAYRLNPGPAAAEFGLVASCVTKQDAVQEASWWLDDHDR